MDNLQPDELDERLKQMAIAAQRHPFQSKERWLACTKLVQEIQKSTKLCRPDGHQFPRNLYEEIYDVAKQEILLHVFQKIDEYKPEKEVMQWINFLLRKRFFPKAIAEVLGKPVRKITAMSELDNMIENLALIERPLLSKVARQYIEEDPDNLFTQEHMRNHPEVNFQSLALRWLSGKPWEEMSLEFGVKISSMSSFFYRSLDKFAVNLREYLQD